MNPLPADDRGLAVNPTLLRMKSNHLPAFLLFATLLVAPASAELLWHGDPAKGRAVFDNLNFEGAERHSPGTGTIAPATDPVYGPIWRVHKPAADKRA